MPEIYFRLRWPDESETVNYSPSTVIRDYLIPGESYEIADFMQRSRSALAAASARVERKYGHPCSRARATIQTLEVLAKKFSERQSAIVTVMEMAP